MKGLPLGVPASNDVVDGYDMDIDLLSSSESSGADRLDAMSMCDSSSDEEEMALLENCASKRASTADNANSESTIEVQFAVSFTCLIMSDATFMHSRTVNVVIDYLTTFWLRMGIHLDSVCTSNILRFGMFTSNDDVAPLNAHASQGDVFARVERETGINLYVKWKTGNYKGEWVRVNVRFPKYVSDGKTSVYVLSECQWLHDSVGCGFAPRNARRACDEFGRSIYHVPLTLTSAFYKYLFDSLAADPSAKGRKSQRARLNCFGMNPAMGKVTTMPAFLSSGYDAETAFTGFWHLNFRTYSNNLTDFARWR